MIEPLASFYKDEVRAIGRELELAPELLDRHPFPGPGLAIRCLCSESGGAPEQTEDGWILPVRSVGVQGDSRTYRPVLAISDFPESEEDAARLINRQQGINRVVVAVWTCGADGGYCGSCRPRSRPIGWTVCARRTRWCAGSRANPDWITTGLAVSGGADSLRHRRTSGFGGAASHRIGGWHDGARRADAAQVLDQMVEELKALDGVAGVFYDLTNKPPATIEWE